MEQSQTLAVGLQPIHGMLAKLAVQEVWNLLGPLDVVEVPTTSFSDASDEVLVKVEMAAKSDPAHVRLRAIQLKTITALNAKTLPRLNLGRNTVYVGAGEQTVGQTAS